MTLQNYYNYRDRDILTCSQFLIRFAPVSDDPKADIEPVVFCGLHNPNRSPHLIGLPAGGDSDVFEPMQVSAAPNQVWGPCARGFTGGGDDRAKQPTTASEHAGDLAGRRGCSRGLPWTTPERSSPLQPPIPSEHTCDLAGRRGCSRCLPWTTPERSSPLPPR
jgi:hypothetical protein